MPTALVLCFVSIRSTDRVAFTQGVRRGVIAWKSSSVGDLWVRPSRYLLAKAIIQGGLRVYSPSKLPPNTGSCSGAGRRRALGQADLDLVKAQ